MEMDLSIWLQLAVVLVCVAVGGRLGGVGLGAAGGLGVCILVLGMGIQPGSPPTSVLLIITAVIACTSVLQGSGGLDLLVVRELTGGIYFGERGTKETADMGLAAYDVEQYAEKEVERIAEIAFQMAMKRNKKVTSVDKANVLESSRLWRKTVARVAEKYPQVTLENFYVDNAAMQLVYDPKQFDVLVTSNLFGDILSDEASMITGSIGMLPSASLAEGAFGMYEPVHGSAPDIAGTGKANPIAAILSAGMLLRYTLGLTAEADAIEQAVKDVLKEGWRTADIAQAGSKAASTAEMGSLIAEKIR